jgi:hypothetical protein
MTDQTPPAPEGAGPAGTALWADMCARFELEAEEQALLVEAVRTVDQLDALNARVLADGVVNDEGKVNPALTEARAQRAILARLIVSLRVPDEDGKRAQRRGGARKPYQRPFVVGGNQ